MHPKLLKASLKQIHGPTPEAPIQDVWVGGLEFAFPTSSQAMLLPPILESPFENPQSTAMFSGEELIPPAGGTGGTWWAQRRQCGLMQIART